MDVVDQIRAVGNIQAEQRVTVNAEVDGQVRRIFVEEGQRVRRGDLIA
ncbi:MAG: biotin/lipoyl-binding protein, partial [Nitrospinaceae bacterium]|nr:biotin/lipoyl-binding protein [Nitrospinaceae bacterium]NIR57726.1 biotin/lipoyl-binding protein [Nitrospinaceae bacterium]NIS88186.1 biotin/lipoyl-binding protein [Nitrospinaceae bacterium]NIT85068.1 biotin/lipoyl-binding protein [Nitrospinaceae bacterium]NIU45446.1 biotin/lipoyl-binding protein [Nitrospinaceae bacterium]